jgi:hypothetical protein
MATQVPIGAVPETDAGPVRNAYGFLTQKISSFKKIMFRQILNLRASVKLGRELSKSCNMRGYITDSDFIKYTKTDQKSVKMNEYLKSRLREKITNIRIILESYQSASADKHYIQGRLPSRVTIKALKRFTVISNRPHSPKPSFRS